MGHVYFSIPKAIVKRLVERVDVPILVETGTYKGETAFWAASVFNEVHTIELIEEISKSTQNDPSCPKNVNFYIGDSANVLQEVLKKVNQRALFWLDGHWSPFVHEVERQCPLLEELQAISKKQDSIIFIDDATAFYGPMPPPHKAEQWPSLEKIFVTIKELFPSHRFTIMDDVIISAPEDAMKAIESYWYDVFNERYVNKKKSPEQIQRPFQTFGRRLVLKNLVGLYKDKDLQEKSVNEKIFYLLFNR